MAEKLDNLNQQLQSNVQKDAQEKFLKLRSEFVERIIVKLEEDLQIIKETTEHDTKALVRLIGTHLFDLSHGIDLKIKAALIDIERKLTRLSAKK